MISRDSCLQSDTRNSTVISGNVFESLLARGEPSSAFFENSKNLASSSCGLKSSDTGNTMKEGMRRELQGSTIPTPRLTRSLSTWTLSYRTGGTYCQNCKIENPRHLISDLHLGQFPDSVGLQCQKADSLHPANTKSWIKEVEIARSIDDLLTSQSSDGCSDFTDFEMLDAKHNNYGIESEISEWSYPEENRYVDYLRYRESENLPDDVVQEFVQAQDKEHSQG